MLTVGALVVAVVLIAVLVLGGSSGYHYTLEFETGGQLVAGNQVLIGGSAAGTVDSITLADNANAEVKITVDQQLHKGTTAVIRTPSLSTVAGRYISVSPGPDNFDALPSGSVLAGDSTTTPVDLDQLFNTFNPQTRRGLQQVIQGFAGIYAGKGEAANRAYKYFSPALSSTDRLLKELNSDEAVFTDFVVNSSKVVTAIAERRDDLTNLVSNSNTALGAIADQNQSLDRSLQILPSTLRQANTTFVNLRAALDDVDPLVNTSKRATKNLDPFLRELRPVAQRAVPVFSDLDKAVRLPGGYNDLQYIVKALPSLHRVGSPASHSGVSALNASQPMITFARPYAPELLAGFGKLGAVTGYYDADGHYARIESAAFNLFNYDAGSQDLIPNTLSEKFTPFQFGLATRCPGGATQPTADSNPFLDQGRLNGKCDPSNVPPGP